MEDPWYKAINIPARIRKRWPKCFWKRRLHHYHQFSRIRSFNFKEISVSLLTLCEYTIFAQWKLRSASICETPDTWYPKSTAMAVVRLRECTAWVWVFTGRIHPMAHCLMWEIRKWWATPCENVSSDICGHRKPSSACASTQRDQGLRKPYTESLDSIKCMSSRKHAYIILTP